MSCVFSILFAAIGRMVVTGSDYGKSSYGVYQVSEHYDFLLPEISQGIHVSGSRITGPGTHVVAYCSILKDVYEIVEIITKPLTEITHYPERSTREYEATVETCSNEIVAEFVEDTPLSMSKLVRERSCTKKNIIDLAYQGRIKVIGRYSCFAPSGIISPVIVDADSPLSMKDFLHGRNLLKGESSLASRKKDANQITNIPVRKMKNLSEKKELLEFIERIEDPTDQRVLVWYQGNLHLLHRRPSAFPNKNWWYPLTIIGHEIQNAPLIAGFVNKSFPQIDEFTRKMKQFRTSFVRNEKFASKDTCMIETTNGEIYYRKPRIFMTSPTYVLRPGFKTKRIAYNKRNRDTSLSIKDYPNCPPRYYQYAKFENYVNAFEYEIIEVPSQLNAGLPTAKFTEIAGFGQLCGPLD